MALVITILEVGSDVVASGSGSANLTGIGTLSVITDVPSLNPSIAKIYITNGLASSFSDSYFGGITGPLSIGTNSTTFNATSSSSNGTFGVIGDLFSNQYLVLPQGYTGGTITGTTVWASQTFVSMGLTPGTYQWTWASDSLTVQVGPSVTPTPTPTNTSTPTPTQNTTPTQTPTNTSTPTPTNTSTPTTTQTPTNTSTLTTTPTTTPTPTNTSTPTPTNTSTPTPTNTVTPSNTATQTPTPTPSATPFGVFYVDNVYEYDGPREGSFSGGTWQSPPFPAEPPHPIDWVPFGPDGQRQGTVIDLSAITLGGFNGLNN